MKFYRITSNDITNTSGDKFLNESTGVIVSSSGITTAFTGTRYLIPSSDISTGSGTLQKGHLYEVTCTNNVITYTDITPSSGTNITDINIVRPISDLSLYPYLWLSTSPSFDSNLLILDPRTDPDDRPIITVFTGTEWIPFTNIVDEGGNQSGLGTPFDGMNVNIDISAYSFISEPFYVKYCWETSDGVKGPYKSIKYPSLMIYGGNYGMLS